MSSLNKVILLGNLTRDPEIRQTPNGQPVAECAMALNRRFKSANGEMKEEVTYVDLTMWGRHAELARDYCHKGKQLAIEGRLKLDTWESKEGEKRSKLRVIVEQMHFTGSKADAGNRPQPQRTQQRDEWGDPVPQRRQYDDDNLPGLARGSAPAPAGRDLPF